MLIWVCAPNGTDAQVHYKLMKQYRPIWRWGASRNNHWLLAHWKELTISWTLSFKFILPVLHVFLFVEINFRSFTIDEPECWLIMTQEEAPDCLKDWRFASRTGIQDGNMGNAAMIARRYSYVSLKQCGYQLKCCGKMNVQAYECSVRNPWVYT